MTNKSPSLVFNWGDLDKTPIIGEFWLEELLSSCANEIFQDPHKLDAFTRKTKWDYAYCSQPQGSIKVYQDKRYNLVCEEFHAIWQIDLQKQTMLFTFPQLCLNFSSFFYLWSRCVIRIRNLISSEAMSH